jgi:hypothetical protein
MIENAIDIGAPVASAMYIDRYEATFATTIVAVRFSPMQRNSYRPEKGQDRARARRE